jgi:hypothetical protein
VKVDIQSPDYILSRANFRTLMQALPMREKAKNWLSALNRRNMHAANLGADAIFMELWDEQKAILERWGRGKAEEQIKGFNQLLKQIAEAKVKLKSPKIDPSGMGEHFLELMARLSYGAEMMRKENGRIFGWFDGQLQEIVDSQIEEIIKQVFGEHLPSDNSFMAFFGASKSSDADIAEQDAALEIFESKRDQLIERGKDEQEPLYWLVGQYPFRKMYGMEPSAVESTTVVNAREVEEQIAVEASDIKVRTRFEETRKQENEALMPEAVEK